MIRATVIDVSALWRTIWSAAASGVLISIVVGIAVRSYARSHDLRLERRNGAAAAHAGVAVVGALATVAIGAYGIWLITS
jgi:uncharacterized membrane protein